MLLILDALFYLPFYIANICAFFLLIHSAWLMLYLFKSPDTSIDFDEDALYNYIWKNMNATLWLVTWFE